MTRRVSGSARLSDLPLTKCHLEAAQAEPQNGMACATSPCCTFKCHSLAWALHEQRRYFQKACVLISLERYEEALTDLKKDGFKAKAPAQCQGLLTKKPAQLQVRCLAPKEACVHFQLGKVTCSCSGSKEPSHPSLSRCQAAVRFT